MSKIFFMLAEKLKKRVDITNRQPWLLTQSSIKNFNSRRFNGEGLLSGSSGKYKPQSPILSTKYADALSQFENIRFVITSLFDELLRHGFPLAVSTDVKSSYIENSI